MDQMFFVRGLLSPGTGLLDQPYQHKYRTLLTHFLFPDFILLFEEIHLVDDAGVVLAVELMRCGVPGVRLQVRAIWRHSIARVLKMDMTDRVTPEQSYCTKIKKSYYSKYTNVFS